MFCRFFDSGGDLIVRDDMSRLPIRTQMWRIIMGKGVNYRIKKSDSCYFWREHTALYSLSIICMCCDLAMMWI